MGLLGEINREVEPIGEGRYGTLYSTSNDMKYLPSVTWFKLECITICLHFKLQN
jgi:hypothetical protein